MVSFLSSSIHLTLEGFTEQRAWSGPSHLTQHWALAAGRHLKERAKILFLVNSSLTEKIRLVEGPHLIFQNGHSLAAHLFPGAGGSESFPQALLCHPCHLGPPFSSPWPLLATWVLLKQGKCNKKHLGFSKLFLEQKQEKNVMNVIFQACRNLLVAAVSLCGEEGRGY